MSSISGIGSGVGGSSGSLTMPMLRPQRASASDMAAAVMSAADSGKGYLEQADVAQTFSVLTRGKSSLSEEQAAELFSSMDADGDGQLTESELTSSLEKMEAALDQLFQQVAYAQGPRGPEGGQGMPPPPPREDDTGFSAEELQAQLSEIEDAGSDGDAARAELISQVLADFDEADTDGDGKVSLAEARAYEASQSSAATDASQAVRRASGTRGDEDAVAAMRQVARLLETYVGVGDDAGGTRLSVRA